MSGTTQQAMRCGSISLFIVASTLAGCGGSNGLDHRPPPTSVESGAGETAEPTIHPENTPEPPPAELSVTGRLDSIDPDARIMVVVDPPRRHEFTYTDRTQLRGVADPAELVALTGSQVTIYYSDTTGTDAPRLAEQILLQ